MSKRIAPMSIGVIALALLAGTSTAHHRSVVKAGERVADDATQKCECRAHGKAYTVDEQICLHGRMVTCAMDQNVTSWRATGGLCPQS